MSLSNLVKPDVKKSAEQFIKRIQRGVYKKDIITNTMEDYSEEEALESGQEFVKTKIFKKLFFNKY